MSPKNNGETGRKSWGDGEMGVRDFAVIIGILGLLMLAGAAVVFFVTQNQPEATIAEATPVTTEQPADDSVDSQETAPLLWPSYHLFLTHLTTQTLPRRSN